MTVNWAYLFGSIFVVGTVVAIIWTSLALRARKRRFLDREILTAEDWFARYVPVEDWMIQPLVKLFGSLGEDVGVAWTRFRPDDTFSETFRTPKGYKMRDMDLDGFLSCHQEDWFRENGLDLQRLPESIDRFGDYVLKLRDLLLEQRCVRSAVQGNVR